MKIKQEVLQQNTKKKHRAIQITLSLLSVILILLNFMFVFLGRTQMNWVEQVYSRKIYLLLANFLSTMNAYFSYSTGEVVLVMAIAFLGYMLIASIIYLFQKNIYKASIYGLIILVVISWNLVYFQLAFGINNYRAPMEVLFHLENAGVNKSALTEDDLASTYQYLVLKTNEAKIKAMKYSKGLSKKEIFTTAYLGYETLSQSYRFISPHRVIVKPLRISPLLSSSGYTGIYLYFVGEPTLNSMPPEFSLGFVASHEIAHQKGFSSENDANFVGFLACLNHENPWFQYSGYEAAMTYVGNSLYQTNKERYLELAKERDQAVLDDLVIERKFWDEHIVEGNKQVHNAINDSFLKANNQPEGIVTYSRVTELIVKAYLKKIF